MSSQTANVIEILPALAAASSKSRRLGISILFSEHTVLSAAKKTLQTPIVDVHHKTPALFAENEYFEQQNSFLLNNIFSAAT